MRDDILNKEKYNIKIDNFEGPMDLLLFLISKHKMNIFDICLSDLTDKYINYLNEMTEENIEIASEFVVMAATLLDIKAKKLLPEIEKKEDEDEGQTEQDIISRIIEYKKYKEISSSIANMYQINFGSFSKPYEKINFKRETKYTGQALDKTEIYNVYISILRRNENKINKNAKLIDKIAIYEKVTVKDKVTQIVNYLKENKNMNFNHMYDTSKCDNIEVATAFLGVLELSKLKQVSLEQEYLFSDINVVKCDSANFDVDLTTILE